MFNFNLITAQNKQSMPNFKFKTDLDIFISIYGHRFGVDLSECLADEDTFLILYLIISDR